MKQFNCDNWEMKSGPKLDLEPVNFSSGSFLLK